jgi:UDP-N-acetylglucosamine transferase subunit ALG13
MILVTTGASQFPFDRLLEAVGELETGEPIVVQHGCSAVRPDNGQCLDFVPMADLGRLIDEARVVVTHAGVGSILLCLSHGRRPIVVPRMKRYRETVDDHQVESARRFDAAGLVTLVEDPADLSAALLQGAAAELVAPTFGEGALVRDLRGYFEQTIETRSPSRP